MANQRETTIREKASAPSLEADGSLKVRIINPGWGSSGYYSKEVVKNDVPKAFPKGTHVYFDHPSESDEWNRPERSVRDIAGYISSDPVIEADGGAYAAFTPFPTYGQLIHEMAKSGIIGMSIVARAALISFGEAEGQEGPIVDRIAPHTFNSVDLVTHAGRGGALLGTKEAGLVRAFESARLGEADIPHLHALGLPVPSVQITPQAPSKGYKMADLTEETGKELSSNLGALVAHFAAEKAAREAADAAKDKVNPLDAALALSTALNEAKFTAPVQAAVIAQIRAGLAPDVAIETMKAVVAAQPVGPVGIVGKHVGGDDQETKENDSSVAAVAGLFESLGNRAKGVAS